MGFYISPGRLVAKLSFLFRDLDAKLRHKHKEQQLAQILGGWNGVHCMLKCGRQGNKCTIQPCLVIFQSSNPWWIQDWFMDELSASKWWKWCWLFRSCAVSASLGWIWKKSGKFIFSSLCLAQTQKVGVKFWSLGVNLTSPLGFWHLAFRCYLDP